MVVTRLRNIFIGIGLLMLAVFLLSLFFERTYLVKREVTIAVSPAKVFPLINTPALWDEWMRWGAPDSSYTYIFMGPPSGRFAKKIMKGPQVDIVFKIIQSRKDTAIRYEISTADVEFTTDGDILLSPVPNGTLVSWIDSGDVGYNVFARFSLKGIQQRISDDMDQSLLRLKSVAEQAR